jgi:hypothetical protein
MPEIKDTNPDNVQLQPSKKAEKLLSYNYGTPVNLTEEERLILIAEIEKHISYVERRRTELGLPNDWREARRAYNTEKEAKTFPWKNCSNLDIPVLAMSTDVMTVKGMTQMFGANPTMILRPLPGGIEVGDNGQQIYSDIKSKENVIEYKTKEEMQIKRKTRPLVKDAILIGTSIGKLKYRRKVEYDAEFVEIFDPIDIIKFSEKFIDDEGTSEYNEYYDRLLTGETVQVAYKKDDVQYDNPDLEYVKLENLYVDPDIEKFEDQAVIPELKEYTWFKLMELANQGLIDKEPILKLRETDKDIYSSKKYKVFEVNCYRQYGDNSKQKRIIFTYLHDTKEELKCITYPYAHREPYYHKYVIEDIPGSFYGRGLFIKLRDSIAALNGLWNQTIDGGTIRNAPMFKIKRGTKLDPTIKRYGPATGIMVENTTDIEEFKITGSGMEMLNFISRIERYCEWLSGVSAYMSGRESPGDPNAPASKAYMLLKESNLRVSEAIDMLHNTNKDVYRQSDALIYQYNESDSIAYNTIEGDTINVKLVPKKVMGIKVVYIPQLSDTDVNEDLSKQRLMQVIQFLQTLPLVQQTQTSQRAFAEAIIEKEGGLIAKLKSRIIGEEQQPLAPMIPQVESTGGVNNIPILPNSVPQSLGGETPAFNVPVQ